MVQSSTVLYSEQFTIQVYIQAKWFKAQQYCTVNSVLYNCIFRLTGSKLSSTVHVKCTIQVYIQANWFKAQQYCTCTVYYTTVYSG